MFGDVLRHYALEVVLDLLIVLRLTVFDGQVQFYSTEGELHFIQDANRAELDQIGFNELLDVNLNSF